MKAAVLVATVAGLGVLRHAAATCAMTQDSTGIPYKKIHEPAPLGIPYNPDGPLLTNPCPEYTDNACCNQNQYTQLGLRLYVSASAFSHPDYGGSPACGENLRQLWCGLTCHPNQSLWMHPEDHSIVVDGLKVMPATIKLGSPYACGLFDSCKATANAAQDSVLSTGVQALLNFMGRDQGKQNGVYYTFEFENATEEDQPHPVDSWNPPVQHCCSYEASIFDLNVGTPPPKASGNLSSPCAVCKSSCPGQTCPIGPPRPPPDPSLEAPMFGPMYGFAAVTNGALYGCIILITAVTFCWNQRSAKSHLLGPEPFE